MDHVIHIQNNKKYLDLRWETLRLIREFFWSRDFVEVETPLILQLPGQEPYLSPMKVNIHDEKGKEFAGFLHTSPEYTMKKMLAAGYEKIFSLGKVFRDYESFGGTHNPEFTMIEWYRANEDFYALMDDVGELFGYIDGKLRELGIGNYELGDELKFKRVHMRDLWKEYVQVNLDEYLEREKMFELCVSKGYKVEDRLRQGSGVSKEPYEDLFYRIFLNEIEPKLAELGNVIVHHYPSSMAALSKLSDREPGYAERFEVYIDGIELANAFTELTDAQEQLHRLQEEQTIRKKLGKDTFDIDKEFIDAVGTMPPSTGIALGVDRLIQAFTDCKNINNVLVLPASKLFED